MCSSPSDGFVIRPTTLADAETIVAHRRAMFFDMGYGDTAWLDEMAAAFLPWLRQKMESGEYLEWFAVAPDGSIAAGAGLWLMDWMPHRGSSNSRRGNVLNVYTERPHQRRGLARRLMGVVLDDCRVKGLGVVILHSSDEGRRLYESLGFKPTNEMRIDLDPR